MSPTELMTFNDKDTVAIADMIANNYHPFGHHYITNVSVCTVIRHRHIKSV